jgi:hypothetical protein
MREDGHYRTIAAAQLAGDAPEREEERPSHMDRARDARKVSAEVAAATRKAQEVEKEEQEM